MFPNIISGISALGLVGAVRARKRLFSASPATGGTPRSVGEEKNIFDFDRESSVKVSFQNIQKHQLAQNVGKENFYLFSQNRSQAQL